VLAALGRLVRGEVGPRELCRKVVEKVVAKVAPAHRTNASGNNQSQR